MKKILSAAATLLLGINSAAADGGSGKSYIPYWHEYYSQGEQYTTVCRLFNISNSTITVNLDLINYDGNKPGMPGFVSTIVANGNLGQCNSNNTSCLLPPRKGGTFVVKHDSISSNEAGYGEIRWSSVDDVSVALSGICYRETHGAYRILSMSLNGGNPF